MRLTLVFPGFAAVALAMPAPLPQEIDVGMVLAAPEPITYDPVVGATAQVVSYDFTSMLAQATAPATSVATDAAATATAIEKRGAACTSLAAGASGAPAYSPDTPAAFASNSDFASVAINAPVPTGYSNTFTNANASNSAYGYLGFTTLSTFDTAKCAAKCDAIRGCLSFNLYFERDPSVDPGSGASGCENPASVTYIKCVFWGGYVSNANANNYGQYRNKFQVLIAGSNGYTNNTLAAPAGYSDAIYYGTRAIDAPLDAQGFNTFITSKIFSGPFDARLCAAACDAQTQYAIDHPSADGTPAKKCQFFNTHILNLNDNKHPQGQYCTLYTEAWPTKYATSTGSTTSSGDKLIIEYSYGYVSTSATGIDPTKGDRNGAIYQAAGEMKSDSAQLSSVFQPFCSSYLGYSALLTTVTATTTMAPVATSTAYATITAPAMHKRDESEDFPGLTTNSTNAVPAVFDSNNNQTWYLPLESITADADASAIDAPAKRDLSTPAVLTKYPVTVISAACSMAASQVTVASTITINQTITAATSTTVTTIVSTATASAVPTSSSTSSSSSSSTSLSSSSSFSSSASSSTASSTSSSSSSSSASSLTASATSSSTLLSAASSTAKASATPVADLRLLISSSGTSADGQEIEFDSATAPQGYSNAYVNYYTYSTFLHGQAITPNFVLDPSTGYLKDKKYGYIMSVYNSNFPGVGLAYTVMFFPANKVKANGYIPVTCKGANVLTCSAKNSWGTVLSNVFVHPQLALTGEAFWSLRMGDSWYNPLIGDVAAKIGFQ
ncbi:hypothetical protein D6C78_10241 [Aureobasidium pullulans]|uniref:Apple domain-containing protein n=1 Tax=Aureobasidium pullulans TaxID=5580 RepID=A0A4T0B781_AURPU|nr:hypothetical protein D6C78_10241 [Aureobasidium pullulans]